MMSIVSVTFVLKTNDEEISQPWRIESALFFIPLGIEQTSFKETLFKLILSIATLTNQLQTELSDMRNSYIHLHLEIHIY
jgi:hypothetical protein